MGALSGTLPQGLNPYGEQPTLAVEAFGEGGASRMTAFEEHREELEHYETMMGPHRGRLAVSLDLLTNALVLVGQHGVYCHRVGDRETPAMDIRIITKEIAKAKELIQSVMEKLREERERS
jgi:hypothetical protein